MTILDDSTSAPKIHLDERIKRLRVRCKVAQSMRAHSRNNIPERVHLSNHTSNGRRIPNVVRKKRNRLITETLAILVNDILISDLIEVYLVWAVIAIKSRDDYIAITQTFFANIFLEYFTGVRDVTALTDNFALNAIWVLRENKLAKLLAIVTLKSLRDVLGVFATALFISEHENNAIIIEARVNDRLERWRKNIERFIIHRNNNSVINLAWFREVALLRRGNHAEITKVLFVAISFTFSASKAVIAASSIFEIPKTFVPVNTHASLEKLVALHCAERNADRFYEVHNDDN